MEEMGTMAEAKSNIDAEKSPQPNKHDSVSMECKTTVLRENEEFKDKEVTSLPSLELMESNIRTFLTKDTAYEHTKRTIREQLAKNFNMPFESLDPFKTELADIIGRVIREITVSNDDPPEEESQETNIQSGKTSDSRRRKRKADIISPNRRAKRRKDESENEQSESESSATDSEQESSEAEEPRSRRKPKAKAKQGAKAAQASLMAKGKFMEKAKALDCRIGSFKFKLEPRVFKTGSCGWYFGSKTSLPIGDTQATCTVGLNVAVVGSKTWKSDQEDTSEDESE